MSLKDLACDMNHYGTFDAVKLKSAGIKLCIHKCVEGETWADPLCNKRQAAAIAAGLDFTKYGWWKPKTDSKKQTAWFIKNAGALKYIPWIDSEDIDESLTMEQHLDRMLDYRDGVADHYGDCGIYTGRWWFEKLLSLAHKRGEKVQTLDKWMDRLKKIKWWISDYAHEEIQLYYKWMTVAIHQRDYNLGKHIPGFNNQAGYDYLLVPLESLLLKGNGAVTTAPVTGEVLSVRKTNFIKVCESLGYQKQGQELLDFWAKAYPNANPKFYALFDVGLKDTRRRFFVIDSDKAQVFPHSAAHGKGSDMNGDDLADKFSDTAESKMTSLGIYRCAETFHGSHPGLSMRLDGLQDTNKHARAREIIMHQAAYVHEGGVVGRSWGCPALDPKVSDTVINQLMGGSPLYIFKA